MRSNIINTEHLDNREYVLMSNNRTELDVIPSEYVLEYTSISHLSFSEKKYSAIPMWERINAEVAMDYPQLIVLAKNSLMCAAVYGMFEARQCGYQNQEHIRHMRTIARENIFSFLSANQISLKFKLYALAVCVGY